MPSGPRVRPTPRPRLRARQRLGKYRIERRLGEGAFSCVYQAMDSIEGIRVALKIPHPEHLTEDVLADFRREIRTVARLEHPNILPIKDASIIDGRLVVALPLGEESLAERLTRRLATAKALGWIDQLTDAVAYAHAHRIIHCDIKPANVILYPEGRLRLGDFGIAKVSRKTVHGGGTGTVGYMAPEQAMGRPSYRSDVFSVGLLSYRLLAGTWPVWPYEWPPDGYARLRSRVHPKLIQWIRRSVDPKPRARFRDGEQMADALAAIWPAVLRRERSRRGG